MPSRPQFAGPCRAFSRPSAALRALALCAAMVLATSVSVGPATAQGGPAPVEVDRVITEPLAQTAPVIGRMVARERGTVAALTRGPVAEVRVDVGDRVREGDVLVRLAADRLEQTVTARRAGVTRQQAALETARSQLDLAQQELARLERLKDSPAFSQARYDDKQREVATVRARVGEALATIESARAEMRLAEIDLDLATIKAPFNGVVLEKHMVRGAYANVGDRAVTLLNDEDLEIEADVPTRLIAGLSPGRVVEMRLSGDAARHDAIVRAQVPEENALTKTRLVRFVPGMEMDALERRLAAGQTVTVLIPVGEPRDVVTVHKDAVLAQGGSDNVFLVRDDGTVASRPVALGTAVGMRFVVEDGLEPGDLVVTLGNERLRPGQAVTWPGKQDGGAGDGGEADGAPGADGTDGADKSATSGATAG